MGRKGMAWLSEGSKGMRGEGTEGKGEGGDAMDAGEM